MAYIQPKITTKYLWRTTQVGTSGTLTSDAIDMRDLAAVGSCALTYKVNKVTAATAGTVAFTYQYAPTFDGTYIQPSGAGTIGTATVVDGNTALVAFTPVLAPFIKVVAICGTSAPALVTAEVHIR
jgi:hypothetical protein